MFENIHRVTAFHFHGSSSATSFFKNTLRRPTQKWHSLEDVKVFPSEHFVEARLDDICHLIMGIKERMLRELLMGGRLLRDHATAQMVEFR